MCLNKLLQKHPEVCMIYKIYRIKMSGVDNSAKIFYAILGITKGGVKRILLFLRGAWKR